MQDVGGSIFFVRVDEERMGSTYYGRKFCLNFVGMWINFVNYIYRGIKNCP